MIIAKQRNGPTGTREADVPENKPTRFENLSTASESVRKDPLLV